MPTQVETVLFGADGVVARPRAIAIVLVSSTVDPAYVGGAGAAPCRRAASRSSTRPVSGGPAKAAAGTMTMMVSGRRARPSARVRRVLDRIAGRAVRAGAPRRRRVDVQDRQQPARRREPRGGRRGPRAGARPPVSTCGACAMSSTRARAGAGSSPIASRVRSTGDLAPRAAVTLLAKDVGIAATLAERLDVDAPFTRLATKAFAAAAAAAVATTTTRH